jgi:hypothetical protein
VHICKIPSLAIVLLTISGFCCAQTVTLSIVRLGCGSPLSPLLPPPTSQQEREQISAEWVGSDELAVDSWDDETVDSQVDPNTAKVHLDGTTLTISYSHRRVVLDRSKPIPECLFSVKLFFTISGLPRSHYQLRIEDGHSNVRSLAIDG